MTDNEKGIAVAIAFFLLWYFRTPTTSVTTRLWCSGCSCWVRLDSTGQRWIREDNGQEWTDWSEPCYDTAPPMI